MHIHACNLLRAPDTIKHASRNRVCRRYEKDEFTVHAVCGCRPAGVDDPQFHVGDARHGPDAHHVEHAAHHDDPRLVCAAADECGRRHRCCNNDCRSAVHGSCSGSNYTVSWFDHACNERFGIGDVRCDICSKWWSYITFERWVRGYVDAAAELHNHGAIDH